LAVKKAKSKAWYTLISPEIFGAKEMGKTTAVDPDYLKGRKVTSSAIEITNNFAKYYMKFKFRISDVQGDKAITQFDGSECMRDYISRMVLRHVRRIDAVQDLKTKDGVKIRVKSLAITSKKMKSSIVKIVRMRMQEMVADHVGKSTLGDFIEDMMDDRAKGKILNEIRRIYPVRNFEFRKTEVLA
jgi:small subunit ribosomal protein S3Ae